MKKLFDNFRISGRTPKTTVVKPRKRATAFPPSDPSITVRDIHVVADSPMGPLTHHQTFPPVRLQPGDSIQFTWTYKGPGLE